MKVRHVLYAVPFWALFGGGMLYAFIHMVGADFNLKNIALCIVFCVALFAVGWIWNFIILPFVAVPIVKAVEQILSIEIWPGWNVLTVSFLLFVAWTIYRYNYPLNP
jgi:hypothetical protein